MGSASILRTGGVPIKSDGIYVYRFYSWAGDLLYAGITNDMFERFSSHRRSKWWRGAARMTWEEWPDRESAMKREAEVIQFEHPMENRLLKCQGCPECDPPVADTRTDEERAIDSYRAIPGGDRL